MSVSLPDFVINKGMWGALNKAGGGWYVLRDDLKKYGHEVVKNTLVNNRFKVTRRMRRILHGAYGIPLEDFEILVRIKQVVEEIGDVECQAIDPVLLPILEG